MNTNKFKRTGLSIIVGFALAICFYLLYKLFFGWVVSLYASYDPSFGTGLGALILGILAPNVLGFFSAAIVTKRIFPHANRVILFYGLTVIIAVMCLAVALVELQRSDPSFLYLLVISLILALTIFSMKLVLITEDERNLKNYENSN